MLVQEQLESLVTMFSCICGPDQGAIEEMEEYYFYALREAKREAGAELQFLIDGFTDESLDFAERESESPSWGCVDWGIRYHDWTTCPECLYRLGVFEHGQDSICSNDREDEPSDSDDPEDRNRIMDLARWQG
jgi:hypothetical protein